MIFSDNSVDIQKKKKKGGRQVFSIMFSWDMDYEVEITVMVLSQLHFCISGLWW